VVLFEDECHLKHGDAEGYVWGQKGERVQAPMSNERDRKTYYGAIDLKTHQSVVKEYGRANMENTVDFLEHLMAKFPAAKQIIMIWDGATFHTGGVVREFLRSVNHGLRQSAWKIRCLLFAPNAPDQNPTEDCWLKAKTYVRQHVIENKTFQQVAQCFVKAFDVLDFNFHKFSWYF
jgi:transposase